MVNTTAGTLQLLTSTAGGSSENPSWAASPTNTRALPDLPKNRKSRRESYFRAAQVDAVAAADELNFLAHLLVFPYAARAVFAAGPGLKDSG